jgi:Glycosyl hydrolase family 20, catalytic domain/Glycosyl hydrolase family 20, domain 2
MAHENALRKTRFLLPKPKYVEDVPGALLIDDVSKVSTVRLDDWSVLRKEFGLASDPGPHGYMLHIGKKGVSIAAVSEHGFFYAVQTLDQLVVKGRAPCIRIIDWPDLPSRMVVYDVRGTTVNVGYWKRMLTELARLKINQLSPFWEDDFKYPSLPYLGHPGTFDEKKIRTLEAFAARTQIELVPQQESFGHAHGLLQHDELQELRLNYNEGTVCPGIEPTYQLFDVLYGDIARTFKRAKNLHIGGDEICGWHQGAELTFAEDPRCKNAVEKNGVEGVAAAHFNRLFDIAARHGMRAWVWSDEFLKRPRIAELTNKNYVMCIWNYEQTEHFPEIAQFKEWGFKDIYACPAVHGFNDPYPWYPISFGNIAGFSKAAAKEKILGTATTMWGMTNGGNVENYLYGLAYAAQCGWSVDDTNIDDFNTRFASAWLQVQRRGAGAHVDRLFWFPWRICGGGAWHHREITGFWQRNFEWLTRYVLFGPFFEIAKELKNEELASRASSARQLLRNISAARRSLNWLQKHATRNHETLDSMELAIRVFQHVAKKAVAVYGGALEYRAAHAENRFARKKLCTILRKLLAQLRVLKRDFPALKEGYAQAHKKRCGDPRIVVKLEKAEGSLDTFAAMLKLGIREAEVANWTQPPEALGLL